MTWCYIFLVSSSSISPHLTQILGCWAVILPTRHSVDKRQHLIFGFDEFWLVGAMRNTWNETVHRETSKEQWTSCREHVNKFQIRTTHCNLSWGLALRFPLITDAGSRRECSQIELAPLLYNIWTILIKWKTNTENFAPVIQKNVVTLSNSGHKQWTCMHTSNQNFGPFLMLLN